MTESLHALSGAYVVDALDDDEREAFERHLPGCRDCQAEVASLREATSVMADAVALTPPESLRSSILANIAQVRPLPPETAPTTPTADVVPLHAGRKRFARALAAAAAILVIGGGTAVVWQQLDDSSQTPQLSAADQVLAASDAKHYSIDFADGSSATVVRSANEGKAVLLTQKMAAPPSGKAYELWLRDQTGTMKPAGLMTKAGDHKVLLKGNAAKATGVGITVEPEDGSQTPTTKPIAMFELGRTSA
ncbi:MAG: anti-sigma factor [Marmoricola sp.]